jgi:hypothetical protein
MNQIRRCWRHCKQQQQRRRRRHESSETHLCGHEAGDAAGLWRRRFDSLLRGRAEEEGMESGRSTSGLDALPASREGRPRSRR